MKWVIRVDRVVREYDGASAPKGQGFEARRGEILGFLGLNGTEKDYADWDHHGYYTTNRGKGGGRDYCTTRRCLKASKEEA